MPTDDNGYPTEETLKAIEKWACIGPEAKISLMAFVKSAWWMPDWGWQEEQITSAHPTIIIKRYSISTGGWSGNESLIYALKQNHLFWSLCWIQSRRGGHYIFEVTC